MQHLNGYFTYIQCPRKPKLFVAWMSTVYVIVIYHISLLLELRMSVDNKDILRLVYCDIIGFFLTSSFNKSFVLNMCTVCFVINSVGYNTSLYNN